MADSLRSRGHEAWIVAPGEADLPLRSLGPSRAWSFNDSTAPIKLSPVVAPRLRRAVADADVVHVHEPLMPLVSIAARWAGRPLVGTFHADPSLRVRQLYRGFPPLRWHLKAFSGLAAVSETARSAAAGLGRVDLIPNGVATSGLPDRDRVPGRITFVGRDDPRKGLDIALAAFGIIRAEIPAAHLVIVTPDAVAPAEGVILHRGIDDVAKAELLATSEVFVAPNRRGESFGLTVAEAMAAGAGCVVSDIPAFAAVVGDAAIKVPADSPGDLAQAVIELLADDAIRGELSRKAIERAADFSIERTVDAYLQMYRAAVG
jgi:phosphatidylinositol alpha-mannosyltransferase